MIKLLFEIHKDQHAPSVRDCLIVLPNKPDFLIQLAPRASLHDVDQFHTAVSLIYEEDEHCFNTLHFNFKDAQSAKSFQLYLNSQVKRSNSRFVILANHLLSLENEQFENQHNYFHQIRHYDLSGRRLDIIRYPGENNQTVKSFEFNNRFVLNKALI